jgi:hypothetical protein
MTHAQFSQHMRKSDFNTHECDSNTHECDFYKDCHLECDSDKQSATFTRMSVKVDKHEFDFDTQECDYDSHKCDSNNHECSFHTYECNFEVLFQHKTCDIK